ncbi:hypothetical protein FIBSPDRAFT_852282 [Athelia psychrophila]|uniref:Uncharacterized protein n=1 Tax=Athelia psychrophila TaxID=1759441 RepID=A0A166RRE4_9AGAM|nr:hypothetical protein FIBSPDRAFT_852282 [Fibularhizoctonia sp. CBS 109695]
MLVKTESPVLPLLQTVFTVSCSFPKKIQHVLLELMIASVYPRSLSAMSGRVHTGPSGDSR